MRKKIIVELPDYRIIIVGTYRSIIGKFYTFFSQMELVIEKVTSNGGKLILSGGCNMIFFLQVRAS